MCWPIERPAKLELRTAIDAGQRIANLQAVGGDHAYIQAKIGKRFVDARLHQLYNVTSAEDSSRDVILPRPSRLLNVYPSGEDLPARGTGE